MTREPTLGATGRAALLASLANETFDVLVLGGGIGGACAAWDAALRGLKVALVERLDFCAGTSAQSFKVLHGGIRYLQHLDLPRLRESCRERGSFLRIAPHLTRTLPIAVPTFGYGMQSRWLLAAAFVALESLTLDRNWGIDDSARAIPSPFLMSRGRLLERFPGMKSSAATGAGVFYDGQIRNPPRAVLAVLRAAAEAGAVVLNYCEADGLELRDGQVWGARVVDLLGGSRLQVRAGVTINATGPFAPDLLRQIGRAPRVAVPLSRDMAVVVRRQLDPGMAVAVQTRFADPDALISRGNRHLFLAPWRGKYTLIGVNSRLYTGNAYDLEVTEAEVSGFLAEINEAYPGLDLAMEDVSTVNAGLLPFGENDPQSKDLSFGKRSVVVDHEASDGLKGLITGMSIRWTMGRLLGERVVDLAERKLRGSVSRSRTDRTPVWGGNIESLGALEREIRANAMPGLNDTQVSRIACNYGAEWRNVLALSRDAPGCIAGSDYLIAELKYAVRHELAATLADVIMRRLDMGSGERPEDATLLVSVDLMGEELGWDGSRRARELQCLHASYPFASPGSQHRVLIS
ncbi:MAG TPA: FAD-dependent oxidoreductase [Steroidobacteraceae bacterium]